MDSTSLFPGSQSTRMPSRIQRILILLAIIGGVAAGYAYRQHHRYEQFEVHDPGKLYRSDWVDPETMREIIQRRKIRTVVNLCDPGRGGEHLWDLEREAVGNASARLLELPMPESLTGNDSGLEPHRTALRNPENFPMLVHAHDDTARTSRFLALYDIEIRGFTAKDALAAQAASGRQHLKPALREFCESLISRL